MEQGEAKVQASTASVVPGSVALREEDSERPPLLVPGDTCWRIEHADRVGVLIDAAPYFAALRDAMLKAQKHIVIVGWDVDSRTHFCGDDPRPRDGLPVQLLAFLRALLRKKPELQVYILSWDFSMIYALEREWMPSWVFSHAHPRLHYLLDSAHVVGASHHQKLVVIDDSLAFTGGVDLTIRRWDRPAHDVDDKARKDPDGAPYDPMHDVQICVQGKVAYALAELVRERWRVAAVSGHGSHSAAAIGDMAPPNPSLWPDGLTASFEDVDAAISRTGSGTNERPVDTHEILALTRRVFETAERYVYIENQYFTASNAASALCASLERPEGPEIILVLPVLESGWLEQSSMGVLKRNVLARLRKSDRHGRLHIYYPTLPRAAHGLHIHCKLLISDDRVLKIGSANLSNRSLGLDTECDITIEADPSDERLIRGVRYTLARLLAEHLDMEPNECSEELVRAGSPLALIEARRGQERCLELLPESLPDPAFDLSSLGNWAVDPERPMAGETFIAGFYPTEVRKPWLRSTLASVTLFVPVVIMAFVFQDDMPWLAPWLQSSDAMLVAWLIYVVACSLFMPISVLASAACVLLDPLPALGFSLSGALLSAALSYGIGRRFRPWTFRVVRSQRARQLQHSARTGAFRATVVARLLPAGNFAASNLMAGALAVPFRRYMLGNLAGLGFGLSALVVFTKSATSAVNEPTAMNMALCCVSGMLMIALSYGVARAFARPQAPHRPTPAAPRNDPR